MPSRLRPTADQKGQDLTAKCANLEELRRIVGESRGPTAVLAITNGGDGALVAQSFAAQRQELFRRDGRTAIWAHEETRRRGQLLGLLDAVRHARRAGLPFGPEGVALGIMLPGQGTRLSPLTQRLHGIKPFFPMLFRSNTKTPWLTGASASVYTWTLVAYHLQRLGFCGIAWKWGDEPQLPATSLAALDVDLTQVDAIRFGSRAEINEDLAANKEWLRSDPRSAELLMQVRRRPRTALLQRFGLVDTDCPVHALVHIGSPAFSYAFMAEAEALFCEWPGWLDVDGYLFEALTQSEETWQAEQQMDAGLRTLVAERPDFYSRVRDLRRRLEDRRGRALSVKVIDFGENLYWGDIGQLAKARQSYTDVLRDSPEGEFARRLAALADVVPDRQGNRLAGHVQLGSDCQLRDSLVIDSTIVGPACIQGAVVVDSTLGRTVVGPGSVICESVIGDLDAASQAFAFRSVAATLKIPAHFVHTSLPIDPADLARGLQDGWADARQDPGRAEHYRQPCWGNDFSFAAKFDQLRQRVSAPDIIEAELDRRFRAPLIAAVKARMASADPIRG